ncbi:SDR family oxidoreductase [Parasphingopyxis algicola]|uniref:SDR family NAD(P)-dependent oxidoreductase n=1 Tax=Parasphingopyxis algicola TaxID=2026624 RepID=UPI0015A05A3B|nr:SDR family oxidoreductase [Parasphingopyxis algicola]QLC26161.1 SDR family oxidoreductase [Parasphingopyxis algicola]
MANPYTLVTGASSGLGKLFARACAKRGDKVAIVARRKNKLKELAEELGPDTIVISEDLSDYDAPDAIVETIEQAGAHVGTLINNAGFGARGEFRNLPIGDQTDMIQVNVLAVTQLCHRVIPSMLANGGGAILNVASTASFQAGPGMAVYYASKAFVLSLSEALHEELESHNIAVTALCPGATKTEFAHRADMTDTTLFQKFAGEPESVVEAGLKGLAKNKAIVIPGAVNKAMVQSNRLAPRAVTREIVKLLQQ